MKIDEGWMQYLNGAKFNSGARFNIQENNEESGRIEHLLKILGGGKALIHLGACDHLDLIEKKIAADQWLHKRLMEKNHVIGFDISGQAVDYCNALGYRNIYCRDMIREPDNVLELLNRESDGEFDYIVAGEIVEHLDDPVGFLRELNRIYAGKCKRIIITVPNVFYYKNAMFAFKGVERINTDHRFWFSPYTICKVVTRAGMSVEEIELSGIRKGKAGTLLKIFSSQLASGNNIVCIARLNRQLI